MLQNYYTDLGFIYYAVRFAAIQTLIIETVTNQSPVVVLQTFLPTINAQVFTLVDTCALPRGIRPRKVEIELVSNNTKYAFDIPFNSSDTVNWSNLLNDLENLGIKNWNITGEKIPGYKVPLLLTKVP